MLVFELCIMRDPYGGTCSGANLSRFWAAQPLRGQSPRRPSSRQCRWSASCPPLSIATASRNLAALRNRLRELGYTEERNINIEYRFGDGLAERFPVLVADLLALKPAVIVVGSTAGILAARKVTRIIPLIWFGSVEDPVALGLVESFAHACSESPRS